MIGAEKLYGKEYRIVREKSRNLHVLVVEKGDVE